MARIVAGIGTSHVPSIGRAHDLNKQTDPAWKPLFDAYVPVREWLAEEIKPDVVILIYNDHGSDFGLDKCPTFALGAAQTYQVADEGFGRRNLPDFAGDADLSWHLAEHLILKEDFDITMCQEMALDHGFLVPMNLLFTHDAEWSVKVIPLVVNVIQHPVPLARRCYQLGQAIRRGLASYPKDTRVAIVGTGGMSHQLHGERFGHMNEAFDQMWLDKIDKSPLELTELSHRDIMHDAGAEAVELIMWLVMRGAMAEQVECIQRSYYAPMTTGMGLITFVDSNDNKK